MITRFLHARMRVNDLERTVKFYEEALGLKTVRRHALPDGVTLVFMETPGKEAEIEICHSPKAESVRVPPDLVHLAFAVEDMTAFIAELGRKGYRLTSGPTTSKMTGNILAFVDAPEGYGVELIQLAKPGGSVNR